MSRDHVVSLRLDDDEHSVLTDLATAAGVPLSELVRRAALALTYPTPPAVSGTTTAPLVRLALIPKDTL